jgi:hypothetical protein
VWSPHLILFYFFEGNGHHTSVICSNHKTKGFETNIQNSKRMKIMHKGVAKIFIKKKKKNNQR